ADYLLEQDDVVESKDLAQKSRDADANTQPSIRLKSPSVAGTADLVWTPTPQEKRNSWEQSERMSSMEHCMLGQCRQSGIRLNASSTEYLEPRLKNGVKVAGLQDVLNKMQESMTKKQQENKVCTLYFLGDSLTSDTTMAAVCTLVNTMGYQITRCKSDWLGGPAYGLDREFCERNNLVDKAFESQTMQQISYFELENEDATAPCHKVRVKMGLELMTNATGFTNVKKIFEGGKMNDEYGLLIASRGVHCNSPECMQDYMRNHLQPLLTAPSDDNYQFLWREHEPQHFGHNPGAAFALGNTTNNMGCGPPRNGVYNNFRNEIAETFLREHGFLGNGTSQIQGIVRIYDALKPLWGLHQDKDCTHYCFSPWRFEATWHGIYQAMIGNAQ
ncbi:MAG: hypothetical protein SGILL_009202, partial [Bacillariaceae sp.]